MISVTIIVTYIISPVYIVYKYFTQEIGMHKRDSNYTIHWVNNANGVKNSKACTHTEKNNVSHVMKICTHTHTHTHTLKKTSCDVHMHASWLHSTWKGRGWGHVSNVHVCTSIICMHSVLIMRPVTLTLCIFHQSCLSSLAYTRHSAASTESIVRDRISAWGMESF